MHVLNRRGLSPTLHRSQSMVGSMSPKRVILKILSGDQSGVVTTNSVIIRSNVGSSLRTRRWIFRLMCNEKALSSE